MSRNYLLFVTGNEHKQKEASQVLPNMHLLSLVDIDWHDEILEPFETLEENARHKAHIVYKEYGNDCFAEDTGLEVDALKGAPGVFTARYSGTDATAKSNYELLLSNLQDSSDRKAQFRSILHLFFDRQEFVFEGILEGHIASEPRGDEGFGYDPVFIPKGYQKTLAELSEDIKNDISHRAIALRKMAEFLKSKEY